MIRMQDHKGKPHWTKWPYSDEEDKQTHATSRVEVRLKPGSNVSPLPQTTPPSGKYTQSMSMCLTSQATSSSKASPTGRRSRMAGDDMKLPMFHGNGTDDPKKYWFLCEVVWTTYGLLDRLLTRMKRKVS